MTRDGKIAGQDGREVLWPRQIVIPDVGIERPGQAVVQREVLPDLPAVLHIETITIRAARALAIKRSGRAVVANADGERVQRKSQHVVEGDRSGPGRFQAGRQSGVERRTQRAHLIRPEHGERTGIGSCRGTKADVAFKLAAEAEQMSAFLPTKPVGELVVSVGWS